jgi:hypothetical protein
MTLAIQDWRATFCGEDDMLTIINIHSGYSKTRMAEHLPDPAGTLKLHREFCTVFG